MSGLKEIVKELQEVVIELNDQVRMLKELVYINILMTIKDHKYYNQIVSPELLCTSCNTDCS